MAPTFRHGRGGYLSLSDTGGTTFVLSSGLNDCSLGTDVDLADVTTFGDSDRVYIPGLRGHSGSFSGFMASTHEEKLRGMLGNSTAATFAYGPQGNTTGYTKLSGALHLTNINIQSAVGDAVSVSGSFTVTGNVTSTKF
jgi:hypothetical protein